MSILAGRGFQPRAAHPAAQPPRSPRRQVDAGRRVAAAGVLPARRREPSRLHPRRSGGGARGVGIIDVGTLGKLEVIGPEAAEFLERVYTASYANLKVGMTRYAVMCDEAGVVIDDGVVARLAEDHFYFTTTTSGAATIYREPSRLNTMWRLDCGIVNHTGAFAAVNLAGPNPGWCWPAHRARSLRRRLPYLAVREAEVAGIPARLMRVGFVGEWGYEIHVPANSGGALWGRADGCRQRPRHPPFGVEAQRLLRLEKATSSSARTPTASPPRSVGLDWALKMNKPLLRRPAQPHRRRSPAAQAEAGGHPLPGGSRGPRAAGMQSGHRHGDIAGRVTSIAFSPAVGCHIGLAFVKPELAGPAPGSTSASPAARWCRPPSPPPRSTTPKTSKQKEAA